MQSRIGPRIPTRSNTCHSKPRGTVSNAFLKSTKQQYSFPDAFPCRACFCLSIKDFNTNISTSTYISNSIPFFYITCRLIVQLRLQSLIPPRACLPHDTCNTRLFCGCICCPKEPPARCLGIRGRFPGSHHSDPTTSRTGSIRLLHFKVLVGCHCWLAHQ